MPDALLNFCILSHSKPHRSEYSIPILQIKKPRYQEYKQPSLDLNLDPDCK